MFWENNDLTGVLDRWHAWENNAKESGTTKIPGILHMKIITWLSSILAVNKWNPELKL